MFLRFSLNKSCLHVADQSKSPKWFELWDLLTLWTSLVCYPQLLIMSWSAIVSWTRHPWLILLWPSNLACLILNKQAHFCLSCLKNEMKMAKSCRILPVLTVWSPSLACLVLNASTFSLFCLKNNKMRMAKTC